MGRAERRARDRRHGARVRRARLSMYNGREWVGENTVLFYRKSKSLGCGCRRSKKGNPKIGSGMCHSSGYHLCVLERIDGRRICRAWESWLRERGADDFDEGRLMKWRER